MKKLALLFVALALLLPAAAALADEAQVDRYVELLRQDTRDQKEAIIREVIVFKEGEGDKPPRSGTSIGTIRMTSRKSRTGVSP
jgi:hypothetical protein